MSVEHSIQSLSSYYSRLNLKREEALLFLVKSLIESTGEASKSYFMAHRKDVRALNLKESEYMPFVLEVRPEKIGLTVISSNEIGRGASKHVYEAYHCSLLSQNPVWQKVVAKIFVCTAGIVPYAISNGYLVQKTLSQEGIKSVAAPLSNIVVLRDLGVYMEEYRGRALGEHGRPLKERLEIFRQILEFLCILHEKKHWIWGDLHSRNVLVEYVNSQPCVSFTDLDAVAFFRSFSIAEKVPGTVSRCPWSAPSHAQWFQDARDQKRGADTRWNLPDTDIYALTFLFYNEGNNPLNDAIVQRVGIRRSEFARREEEKRVEEVMGNFFTTVIRRCYQDLFELRYRFYTAGQVLDRVKKWIDFLQHEGELPISIHEPEGVAEVSEEKQTLKLSAAVIATKIVCYRHTL